MSAMQVSELIRRAGGVTAVAKAVGLHHSSVIGWRRNGIPPKHARTVAALAGIHPHDVRPDLYDAPDAQPQDAA